jgi:16S rRNA G1207 methylase RsmC
MIADNFDSRTRANMDAALERACALLPTGAEQHENRRYIAGQILKCAEGGDVTLSGLTEAGGRAARELCERLARPKGSRAKAHKRGSVSPLQRHIE